jgi:hypothetical protein
MTPRPPCSVCPDWARPDWGVRRAVEYLAFQVEFTRIGFVA